MIVPRTVKLLRETLNVLLEAAPKDVDMAEVRAHIWPLPGVEDVHDLHAWTITSGHAGALRACGGRARTCWTRSGTRRCCTISRAASATTSTSSTAPSSWSRAATRSTRRSSATDDRLDDATGDVPDREQVYGVNAASFGTDAEAGLVDALREDPEAWLPGLSYVAEAADGTIAAYALLTRCHVDDVPALALAPSRCCRHQRQGAGGRRTGGAGGGTARGERLVLVLGHPEYYPRFGFVPASGTASGRASTFRTRR